MAIIDDSEVAWDNFLRQHKNSPKAEAFVKSIYAPTISFNISAERLKTATDVDKATGGRLDAIGSIVGVSRYLSQGITLAFFGFRNQPSGRGFGQARMRYEGEAITQAYEANDIEYRSLIKAKIALNNSHGTAPELEQAAMTAFRAPVCSARDAGNASINLWVGRIPSVDEGLGRVIPDFLPRPAGVKINIVFWNPSLPFGFKSNNHFGFGIGVLARTPQS